MTTTPDVAAVVDAVVKLSMASLGGPPATALHAFRLPPGQATRMADMLAVAALRAAGFAPAQRQPPRKRPALRIVPTTEPPGG